MTTQFVQDHALHGASLAVHDESTIVQRIECSAGELEALKGACVDDADRVPTVGAPSWLATPTIAEKPAQGTAHGYGLMVHDDGVIVEWIDYPRGEFEALKVRLATMRSGEQGVM